MKIYKINLTPYGSISNFPDSQTIFGGICWAIKDLYGENNLEELLENFQISQNRFVVSSAYIDGTFKAPLEIWSSLDENINIGKRLGIDSSKLSRKSKLLKKINFMSEKVFRDYMKGELDRKEVAESLISGKGKYIFKEGVLYCKDDEELEYDLYVENGRRNFINRITGTTDEGDLYYFNRSFLSSDIKLYFLIKTEQIEHFLPIFKFLSDSAIGGNKSIGMNSYKLEFQGEFQYEKNIDESILISKYIPYYDEVVWDKSYFKIGRGNYKIESRFEFTENEAYKDEVGYLIEGSKLIVKEKKDIYGRLPVVKEISGKKIRHNGLGFFL